MAISQTPKFSQMQTGKQIAKPLRGIERTGLRMESRGKAYRELKADLGTRMSKTKASGMALDLVVGTKERGSSRDKLNAMRAMGEAGRLKSGLKDGSAFRLNKAVHLYEAAVDANKPNEKPVSKDIEDPEVKRANIRKAELHNKMRSDHDANAMRTNRSDRVSGIGGREDNVTTSISHVSSSLPKSEDQPIMQLD